jgi:RND family efflux transporter MFP subunit
MVQIPGTEGRNNMKNRHHQSQRRFAGVLSFLPLVLCLLTLPGRAAESGAWVSGITEAINDVVLSAPTAGIISKRPFKEGDPVKAGETIIELDKRLEELEVSRRKYVLDLKKTDMDTSKKIFEKTISLSREEMDKKITEFSVAEAEHALAKEQLQRRFVIAPFEGTIAVLTLEVGEACQAQQALVRLVDTRKCYFVCNIEAKSGYGLKPGQTIKLEIEAGEKTQPFNGTVFFVSPVVDPASGLMRIKVVFDNPEGKIRPGVSGRMLLEEGKDA